MAITYAELLRRIPLWLYAQNRSLVAEMPAIIEEMEDELMLVLDHDLFRTTLPPATISPAAPGLYLGAKTPAVMEVRAIALQYRSGSGYTPLERREIEALRMLYPQHRPRRPRYYAEDGDLLRYAFFPPPDREYEVKVTANVRPLRLGPNQQTNILTDQFPRATEKATLRQACLFMKNYTDAETYRAEMMQSVEEANLQTARRRRDETGTKGRETANTGGR